MALMTSSPVLPGMFQSVRTASFGDIRAEAVDTEIYFGEALKPGARIEGPAIVEEATSTLVIYPGMNVQVTASGHYLAELSNDK